MFYLCRKGHFNEIKGGRNDLNIFCPGCKTHIPKFSTYKFRRASNGLLFLARHSEPYYQRPKSDKTQYTKLDEKRAKLKWAARRYRATPRGRERKNAANRAYRARQKLKNITTTNTTANSIRGVIGSGRDIQTQ